MRYQSHFSEFKEKNPDGHGVLKNIQVFWCPFHENHK